MKAGDSSFLPSLVGLALLLIVIVTIVPSANFNDLPRTPEKLHAYLSRHQKVFYYMQGETLAKKVFNPPSAHWRRQGIISESHLDEAGNELWFVGGTITVRGNAGTVSNIPWGVIFPPDAGTALYTRVGNIESGDPDKARKTFTEIFTERRDTK